MLKLKLQYLATWCEELTHWKRAWCWERLKAGGEGDDRGRDGWMASLTWRTWIWVKSGSWWWTGRPSVLQSMGSQRVGHDWATELNWTDGTRCHDLHFFNAEIPSQLFYSLSPLSKGSLVPLHFLPLEWYRLPIWGIRLQTLKCIFVQVSVASFLIFFQSIRNHTSLLQCMQTCSNCEL